MTAVACVAVFYPTEAGALIGRHATTAPEKINLRASPGGTMLGLGAALAFSRWQTKAQLIAHVVMWMMIGFAVARMIGFILDGSPDTLQWFWMTAEVVIAAGCGWYLRTRRVTRPDSAVV
ncbi:MAG: DUF4345 family protein [Nannocystaceae bacterium]|nr:DUF4345 family protein [Nannocystaceae bacterium]